ncbi:4'-phosphopantetheinyl transferase family protein [Streptomyces sp. NPDC058279]|jgi:4'-phosphopantetheinyl transferase|uniref:4'-phosphopantetheinyl transferase family protein n=1 Tax=Streptomyces sp. NPDC058279 TaxID=3346418 RepID=UPI0036EC6A1F
MDAWLVDLDRVVPTDISDPAGPADALAGLTEDELRRGAEFVHARAAHRFFRARLTVRRLLADRLGLDPRDLRIHYDPAGKPYLPDRPGTHISWSRSDGLLLLGATETGPVGVDVELVRPDATNMDVLSFVYPAVPATATPRTFFHAWTLLEAAVKATGRGLARGAREVDLDFGPGGTVALRGITGHGPHPWHGHTSLHPIRPSAPSALTAFVSHDLPPFRVRPWPPR